NLIFGFQKEVQFVSELNPLKIPSSTPVDKEPKKEPEDFFRPLPSLESKKTETTQNSSFRLITH
ncbi:hypothetical protein, partial [Levilactobacillus tujiorum]|uniref:hypothetical protein n=1 Tax=Levilactobacillus tujiorum TaxID=2912243 RepID=UPI001B3B1DF4